MINDPRVVLDRPERTELAEDAPRGATRVRVRSVSELFGNEAGRELFPISIGEKNHKVQSSSGCFLSPTPFHSIFCFFPPSLSPSFPPSFLQTLLKTSKIQELCSVLMPPMFAVRKSPSAVMCCIPRAAAHLECCKICAPSRSFEIVRASFNEPFIAVPGGHQVLVRAVDYVRNEIQVEPLRQPAKAGEEVLQHCNCNFLDVIVDGVPRVYVRVDEKIRPGQVCQYCFTTGWFIFAI